jgi:hypothetical protein
MQSLAIWYKPKDTEIKIEPIEFHVNLWKLPIKRFLRRTKVQRFFDIGIHLFNAKNIKTLYIYYPKKISLENVQDLGKKIIESDRLINTLFNENYTKKINPNTKSCEIINGKTNETEFHIYELGENNINITERYDGTIIEINLRQHNEDKTYLRLRIDDDYTDVFSSFDSPSNSILQSAFSNTEIIDFRINEPRDLNKNLLEDISQDGDRFNFYKIQFFFICSSREEYMFSHEPFLGCRQLEKDRWEEYLSLKEIPKESILAYHWKKKGELKKIEPVKKVNDGEGDADTNAESEDIIEEKTPFHDYNALIKTRYEYNDFWTILIYLVVLSVLTISINYCSNLIYDKSKNDSQQKVVDFNTDTNKPHIQGSNENDTTQ